MEIPVLTVQTLGLTAGAIILIITAVALWRTRHSDPVSKWLADEQRRNAHWNAVRDAFDRGSHRQTPSGRLLSFENRQKHSPHSQYLQ